jgi:hypothetical protein
MLKKKKEPAAIVTERSRRFRQRKLNRQRAANEIFYRNLLQTFYETRGVQQSDWATVDEFFEGSISPLISREAFIGSLPHLSDVLETSGVYVRGERIEVIRPRYFLKEEGR